MSMNEATDQRERNGLPFWRRLKSYWSLSSVVSNDIIAGRALISVIAILTFLAALAAGAAQLVTEASSRWQANLISEATIQIRPDRARNMDEDLKAIADMVRSLAGVASVTIYSRDESAKMLRPWLGDHIELDDLPIPRIIAISINPSQPFDANAISSKLAQSFPNAAFDDHRGFMQRLALISGLIAATASGIMVLVISATALAIAFATRGAMAGNRDIIEVLHFIGASDSYIAGEFQRHFLRLSLIGGLYGGLLALIILTIIRSYFSVRTGAKSFVSSDFLTLGWPAMAAIFAVVGLVVLVAAIVSRFTVHRTIGRLI